MDDNELEAQLALGLKRAYPLQAAELDLDKVYGFDIKRRTGRSTRKRLLLAASAAVVVVALAVALEALRGSHSSPPLSNTHRGGCGNSQSTPEPFGRSQLSADQVRLATRAAHDEANKQLGGPPPAGKSWQCAVETVSASKEAKSEAQRRGYVSTSSQCSGRQLLLVRLVGGFHIVFDGAPNASGRPAPANKQPLIVAVELDTRRICQVSSTGMYMPELPEATLIYARGA